MQAPAGSAGAFPMPSGLIPGGFFRALFAAPPQIDFKAASRRFKRYGYNYPQELLRRVSVALFSVFGVFCFVLYVCGQLAHGSPSAIPGAAAAVTPPPHTHQKQAHIRNFVYKPCIF